jgi:Holliday junction resolvase RusA-like endonuclease
MSNKCLLDVLIKSGHLKSKSPIKKSSNGKNKYDRLIQYTNNNKIANSDEAYFDKETSSFIFKFSDARLMSNNETLRIRHEVMHGYISSWHNRVSRSYGSSDYTFPSGSMLKFDMLVLTNKNFQDIDNLNASFKTVVDGIVRSSLVEDDTQAIIPIQIPYQVKSSTNKIIVTIREITQSELLTFFNPATINEINLQN